MLDPRISPPAVQALLDHGRLFVISELHIAEVTNEALIPIDRAAALGTGAEVTTVLGGSIAKTAKGRFEVLREDAFVSTPSGGGWREGGVLVRHGAASWLIAQAGPALVGDVEPRLSGLESAPLDACAAG